MIFSENCHWIDYLGWVHRPDIQLCHSNLATGSPEVRSHDFHLSTSESGITRLIACTSSKRNMNDLFTHWWLSMLDASKTLICVLRWSAFNSFFENFWELSFVSRHSEWQWSPSSAEEMLAVWGCTYFNGRSAVCPPRHLLSLIHKLYFKYCHMWQDRCHLFVAGDSLIFYLEFASTLLAKREESEIKSCEN